MTAIFYFALGVLVGFFLGGALVVTMGWGLTQVFAKGKR